MDIIQAIQHYFLMRHLKKIVRQSCYHQLRIIDHMEMLVFAFREEFTEDNKPSQDAFLRECLEIALGNKESK